MQYSTNFNMNKPELNEQYRLSHWNDNTDIIDAEMQAIRSGTDDVMKATLLNFCYPIGSIYWSGVATNPHDLFGGTWVQIKDKFVWAKGDLDVLDATGGEKEHTLTTTEMPTHTHTFSGSEVTSGVNSRGHTHSVTASGTISVTTNPTFSGTEHSHTYTPAGKIASTSGGTDNKTASESAHTHNYSHTHGYTPSGKIASSSGGTDNKTAGMSANATGHVRGAGDNTSASRDGNISWTANYFSSTSPALDLVTSSTNSKSALTVDVSHTHSAYFTGTAGTTTSQSATTTGAGSAHSHTAYFTGTQATLKATAGGTISGGAYKFTGSAVTSGGESQNHTHTVTASGSNSNAGGGGAHNNMPPYVVKYCWQRTA